MSEAARVEVVATVASDDDAEAARAIGARLAAIHAEIAERSMRDLPVFNERLRVEAVGFAADAGRAVGVLVTPWFMNLVVTALPGRALPPCPPGAEIDHGLPGGAFGCIVGEVPGFGRVDGASLFSPMFAFDDPVVAKAVAEAAVAEVMTPPSPSPEPAREVPALDRRALLFGRRGGGEDRSCR